MEGNTQKASADHGWKDLLPTVKLVAAGQDLLPLRRWSLAFLICQFFVFLNHTRPQVSELQNSHFPDENVLWDLQLKYSLLSSNLCLSVKYIHGSLIFLSCCTRHIYNSQLHQDTNLLLTLHFSWICIKHLVNHLWKIHTFIILILQMCCTETVVSRIASWCLLVSAALFYKISSYERQNHLK